MDEWFTQPGSCLHCNVKYRHSKKQCNTNKSQNQHKCREMTWEKNILIQFLPKPMFEMVLFPTLYAKKCVHHRWVFYAWHTITEEFCLSLAQDLCNLPNHIKRYHPSTPLEAQKNCPAQLPILKTYQKLSQRKATPINF